MPLEIERKFLVNPGLIGHLPEGTLLRQGYLETTGNVTVRTRTAGSRGYLTIKGPSTDDGLSRMEFEYEIPAEEAAVIIESLCGPRVLEKVRHEIRHGNRLWEVDVFQGSNSGLVMAEVELERTGTAVEIPVWAVKEVTGDERYYNRRLVDHPRPDLEN
jgi:CYTH domain-containing protein